MNFTIDQLAIFAARAGNIALLKERVQAGANINHIDRQHGSALIEAITHDHMDVVDWLVDNGADVNTEYHPGIGPLEVALHHDRSKICYRLVCAGAKLRKRTRPHYKERLAQRLERSTREDKD